MASLQGMRPIEETTVLITGATDGLGRGVARDLAARGANVLLHGRSREKLDALSAELGGAPTFQADLASLDEVRRLAAEVEAATDELHVLISNAGIGSGRPDGTTRQESKDGLELRLAVNHLAGFLLTLRLLPLLRRSAPARVVYVASLGQAPMDFDDPQLERGYSGSRAYGQSKLAQITDRVRARRAARPVRGHRDQPASRRPTCRRRWCSRSAARRSTRSRRAWRPPAGSPSTPTSRA